MGEVVPIRAPLTRDDIIGKPTMSAIHLDYSRSESAWIYGVAATPRLTVHDVTKRGTGTTRTFLVDGKPVRDLDCALAVINGTMTLEQAMPQPEPPPAEPKPKKISIDQQIEEVRYEIAQRKTVYPRLVRKGSMGEGVADYHLKRMEAVLRTLEWSRDNRELIAKVHAEMKAETPKDPAPAEAETGSPGGCP